MGTGRTGHAEAVRIVFDPATISYGQLLQIHFSVVHDPTQLNRQGPDHGPQYRSTVFATSDKQARVASAYIEQLTRANILGKALATTVETGRRFYPAEAYHQDYMTRNPATLTSWCTTGPSSISSSSSSRSATVTSRSWHSWARNELRIIRVPPDQLRVGIVTRMAGHGMAKRFGKIGKARSPWPKPDQTARSGPPVSTRSGCVVCHAWPEV